MRKILHYSLVSVALGITIGVALWLYMALFVVPEQNQDRLAWKESRSAYRFWVILASVLELRDKVDIDKPQILAPAGLAAPCWELYFSRASKNGDMTLRDFTRERRGAVTLFDAGVEEMDAIKRLQIAVPDAPLSAWDYIAVASVSAKVAGLERRTALAYSPSVASRIYVADMSVAQQDAVLFSKLLEGRDWKRAFRPDPRTWTHIYEVRDEYPQVGRPRLRNSGE